MHRPEVLLPHLDLDRVLPHEHRVHLTRAVQADERIGLREEGQSIHTCSHDMLESIQTGMKPATLRNPIYLYIYRYGSSL